jgi:hypothetical protein
VTGREAWNDIVAWRGELCGLFINEKRLGPTDSVWKGRTFYLARVGWATGSCSGKSARMMRFVLLMSSVVWPRSLMHTYLVSCTNALGKVRLLLI